MAEYIERDKTLAEIDDCFPANPTSEFSKGVAVGVAMAKVAVNHTPASDVRPVVKAKWEWNDNNGYYYCGNCEAVSPREDQYGEYIDCPNFCPNCGADMREET